MTARKPSREIDGKVAWWCGQCQRWRGAGWFYSEAGAYNGLTSHCKECVKARMQRMRDRRKVS